jgi:hypothetical protein
VQNGSYRLFPAVLMDARTIIGGKVIHFDPVAMHLPVHGLPGFESHGFLFLPCASTSIPGTYQSICYPLIHPEERFSPGTAVL